MKSKRLNWGAIAFTVVNSLALAAIFDMSPDLHLRMKLSSDLDIKYSDLAAILLGASALVMTGVGIFIAVITLIGFRQIKVAAVNKAEDVMRAALIKSPDGEDSEFRTAMMNLAEREALKMSEQLYSRILSGTFVPRDWGNQNSDYGE